MKKIPVRTLYLLFIIGIGLIGLGIGSTYAIFTASAEISNPITLNSNLSHASDIIETVEVEVPAGEKVDTTLNITNSSGSTLNYVIWYLDNTNKIRVGSNSNSTGSLRDGDSISVDVAILNSSNNDTVVTLGISSGSNSVVLGAGMNSISVGGFKESDEISYVDNYTGVGCSDVTCMLDYLYDLVD